METQQGFKCGQAKPLSEFYAHPRMANGHLGKCKECTKIDVGRNRLKRADYYNQFDRDRFHNDPKRRECCYRTSKKMYEKYPEKKRANGIVSRAIHSGKLIKTPCIICGDPKVQGHHPDYSKPLEVLWLCNKHHKELHRVYDYSMMEEVI